MDRSFAGGGPESMRKLSRNNTAMDRRLEKIHILARWASATSYDK